MRLLLSLLVSLLLTTGTLAQSVQQSGTVTPGHAARWISNGVLGDAGTAANPLLNSIGVTATGPGICQNSGPITGPYNRLCLSVSNSANAVISLDAMGGATQRSLVFAINGHNFTLPNAFGLNVGVTTIGGGTAGAPLYDTGGLLGEGTRSGNTTKFATANGTLTNGNCVSLDSSGNFVDAGGPCTTSGGGGTVTAGTANQAAYYSSSAATVVGTNALPVQVSVQTSVSVTAPHTSISNGLSYAADPTRATDSTAAIQAAIDTTLLAGGPTRQIYCPAGQFVLSATIFGDLPGNLRGADGTHGRTYAGGTTYALNDTVNSSGIAYISLQNANTGNTPISSPSWWRPFVYNSGTAYSTGDIVSYSPTTGVPPIPFIALQSTTGHAPAMVSTFWRGTTVNPFDYASALSIIGDEGLGARFYGCNFDFQFNQAVGLWVGPGNNQEVANIAFVGCETPSGINACSNGGNQGLMSPNGVGVAIAGGSGGAQFTKLRNLSVANFYNAYGTGINQDFLGAETTFDKLFATNCYRGIWIKASQNDINTVIDPHFGCIRQIDAANAPAVGVYGGNLSTGSDSASFSISGTGSFTRVIEGAFGYSFYTFTTVIGSPDTKITGCATYHTIADCFYNSWIITTPHFGTIPLTMTAYDFGTNTATFQTLGTWGGNFFQIANALANTDLQTEITAATTIDAVERVTTFAGSGLQVSNVHIEQLFACQTIFDINGGVSINSAFATGIRMNADPGDPSGAILKRCQSAFPFINMQDTSVDLTISGSGFDQAVTPAVSSPVTIDYGANSGRLVFRGNHQMLVNPTTRKITAGGNLFSGGQTQYYTVGGGAGEWDESPFYPSALLADVSLGFNLVPQIGFSYAPWTLPRVLSSNYTVWKNIGTTALGTYPLAQGHTIYSVLDQLGAPTGQLVQSAHSFYSYGQTLDLTSMGGTTALGWKGQSPIVLADANTCSWMFPGLGVYINNGAGNVLYEVTGVNPNLSLDGGTHACFFTVLNASSDNPSVSGINLLTGVKTTTYTATSMAQDAYSWAVISSFDSVAVPAASTCGTSPAVGSNSTNKGGNFTTGTAGPSACTLTFSRAYPNVANCTVTPANAAAVGISGGTYVSAQSASAFTITMGAGTSSAKFNYTCNGS